MIEEIKAKLATFQPVLGFDPLTVEQGSKQWFDMRLGVITASRCKDLMAKKGSVTRNTYMMELIAEIATGIPPEQISAKAMEWGNEHEPLAREHLSFVTGEVIHQVPFIYMDDTMRCGISPDGIMSTQGLEIKCPFTSKVHADTLVSDAIKQDYFLQMQFSMYVTGAGSWTFMSYDKRFPSHLMTKTITVMRDEATIKKIDAAVADFIADIDKALEQLGLVYGQQWNGKKTALKDERPEFSVGKF